MWKTRSDATNTAVRKMTITKSAALSRLIITAPLFYGCATTEELDSMRAAVHAAISANKQSVNGQVRQLEIAHRKVQDQQAQLAKQLRDVATKVTDHRVILNEQGRILTINRDSINRLSETINNAGADVRELRQGLESQRGTLTRILDAEEAFHQQGLRSLQAVRQDLSTLRTGSINTQNATGLSSLDMEDAGGDGRLR